MRSYIKPPGWKVVKSAGGIVFVECKQTRFAVHPFGGEGKGEATRLACLLTRKDRQIARLLRCIEEMEMRS